MHSFEYNTREALIQGPQESSDALEAYKSLRRLLPSEMDYRGDYRHIGATAAHKATQGVLV